MVWYEANRWRTPGPLSSGEKEEVLQQAVQYGSGTNQPAQSCPHPRNPPVSSSYNRMILLRWRSQSLMACHLSKGWSVVHRGMLKPLRIWKNFKTAM